MLCWAHARVAGCLIRAARSMRRRVASLSLVLSLLAALLCCARGSDPVPSWHPHRAKHREYAEGGNATAFPGGAVTAGNGSAPAPAAASRGAVAAGFASTLGCGVLASPEWERRVCFGPLAVKAGAGAAGLPLASLNLTVAVRPAGGSATAPWEPACGAALRLVLASQRALLAPDAPLQESECGVHPLRVTLPRDAPSYTAQLRLLHAETSASDAAGAEPALLNARVAVAGALTLPEDAWDDPEVVTAVGEAHAGGGDFWSLNTAQLPRFAEGLTRAPVARDEACTGGDVRGRWQFSHSLYSLELGEPLAWRPHGCHYRTTHGHLAGQCASGWGRLGGGGAWLFAGGSQLAQLAAAIRVVVANETYFWTRLAVPDLDGNNAKSEALAVRVLHTRPRLDTAAEARAAGVEALPVPPPNDDDAEADNTPNAWVLGKHAWVLGLGAADAEIGTPVHAFADDVAGWLQALRDAVDAGKLPSPRRVVWVTAAAGAYKPGPGFAGGVSCAPGAPSCSATRPGSHYAAAGPGGGFAFAAAPLPRSALGAAALRRAPAVRALNAAAVRAVRAAFPEALIVDYEAMTEALPADYSVDGTHWGCDDEDARQAQQAGGPFRCRSLANTAAGNALMHTLCEGFV